MRGLTFEVRERVSASAPERADIACFVGFVRRRSGGGVSPALRRFLVEEGWAAAPTARVDAGDADDPLEDVPLPFESFGAFARHFLWEQRDPNVADSGATYLGAAVRSFFAQGGRKCYVVRLGDPLAVDAARALRRPRLEKLLPGSLNVNPASTPGDRASWHGATHVFGLIDVSFLCLPDLPELVAADAAPLPIPRLPPAGEPGFVECATSVAESTPVWLTPERPAPRCDLPAYNDWADFLGKVAVLLRSGPSRWEGQREIHCVAALPQPTKNLVRQSGTGRRMAAEEDLGRYLQDEGVLPRLQSAFIQLAYPWVRTPGSVALPEQLEGADGVLVGVLARNALQRGTFRSMLGLPLAEVESFQPVPTRVDLTEREPGEVVRGLAERVSLLGPTSRGMQVLSDVTTSASESHRVAPVSRLISVVLRAARYAGLDHAFAASGEATWRTLRYRMEAVLQQLWRAGALRGTTASEAFTVRCDRTTMTQQDLDEGRLVVEVELDPAAIIGRIQVMLSVADGGVSVQLGGTT